MQSPDSLLLLLLLRLLCTYGDHNDGDFAVSRDSDDMCYHQSPPTPALAITIVASTITNDSVGRLYTSIPPNPILLTKDPLSFCIS